MVVDPIMERDDAGVLKSLYRLVQTSPATVDAIVERYPPFLDKFFTWSKTRSSLLRDTFPKKSYNVAVHLVRIMDEDDHRARLYQLAQLPAASGMVAPRQWVQQLAQVAGVPITSTQQLFADAETATGVAEELREVNQQLSFADPMTESAANLYAKKQEVVDRLHDVVANSADPSAIRATALSSVNTPDDAIIKKYNLTDEQARIVLSSGNVVVAAGAGAGKTSSLVAFIEHLVKVRGYDPAEIMACSFTIAASAELSHRVETKAGITNARIGTTHSIARDVIRRNRPEMARYINTTDQAAQLLKLAIAQVGMSYASYTQQVDQSKEVLRRIEAIRGWYNVPILQSFHDQVQRGRTLSDKQIAVLDKFDKKGKTAASVEGDAISPYWQRPVGQWFNLGLKEASEISPKKAALTISNWKNAGQSVDQVRADIGDKDLMVAIFGAYEYLKKHDTVLAPAMDFDDQIILAHQILKTDAKALAREQARYKAVIVDEAQDLNQIQFEFYSMLGARAQNLVFVGDDKQCVDVHALVDTRGGIKKVGDLRRGDTILSYVNGEPYYQVVKRVISSDWTHGRRVTTASGKTLLMSPNHRLWASPPVTVGNEVAVYMMYRSDKGFRVGITNKGRQDGCNYGARAHAEGAERLWILDICPNREAAIQRELEYSLIYGIPTVVYKGENRGINQERVDAIFNQFGNNGFRLLQEKHIGFDYPHWIAKSYGKHGRQRSVLHLLAHTKKSGTMLTMEWTGNHFDSLNLPHVSMAPNNRRRLRMTFRDYHEAYAVAQDIKEKTGCAIRHNLSLGMSAGHCPAEIHASSLHVNMEIPTLDKQGNVFMDKIVSIEDAPGQFIDLEVGGAGNFFANDILTHNSIFAFRGANPKNYIGLAKDNAFQTMFMSTNFRSGSSIVNTANTLIKYNEDRQIPMVCRADEKKGVGSVKSMTVMTHEEAAEIVAREIQSNVQAGESPSDYGILVRNNAEADAYTLGLLVRGIPYRMIRAQRGGFFGKTVVKAMVSWMRLIVGGTDEQVNTAVLEAHMVPGFGLNKAFAGGLARKVLGENYLNYIQRGEKVYEGSQEWRNKNVLAYADTIRTLRVTGAMDSTSLLSAILDIKGQKKSFADFLADSVEDEDLENGVDLTPEQKQAAKVEQGMAEIRPLLIMANTYKDPANMLAMIQKMQDANLKAQKSSPGEGDTFKEPAVLVGTVHSWKGLQAKHTYVSMAGGIFPSSFAEGQDAMDEERRLAYVALTRGEETVTVMSPQVNYLGKSSAPSVFIREACLPEVGLGTDGTVPVSKQARVNMAMESMQGIMDDYIDFMYGGS